MFHLPCLRRKWPFPHPLQDLRYHQGRPPQERSASHRPQERCLHPLDHLCRLRQCLVIRRFLLRGRHPYLHLLWCHLPAIQEQKSSSRHRPLLLLLWSRSQPIQHRLYRRRPLLLWQQSAHRRHLLPSLGSRLNPQRLPPLEGLVLRSSLPLRSGRLSRKPRAVADLWSEASGSVLRDPELYPIKPTPRGRGPHPFRRRTRQSGKRSPLLLSPHPCN